MDYVKQLYVRARTTLEKIIIKLNYKDEDTIFYIGGSETLPSPLNTEEEADLLEMLGTDEDVKAKTILIERNLRLVVLFSFLF